MAKTTAALGVELVGEEVRLALVERSESGITLLATQTVAPGDDLVRVVRSLPRRPSQVTCAVPLEQAAIRILSLPPTTDENLERVVGLEAEGALPLDADDLALSHHMLGMTEQSRLEVLLAAARQGAVQEALRRVNVLPYLSGTATVSAIALVNALQQIKGAAREPVCAVLRIEARGSELLVLDRGRPLVARAIRLGADVAEAVAAPAREPAGVGAGGRVRGAAPVGLGAPVPAWVAPLSQQVRYALQAVCYERGLTIERLYLCGRGAEGAEWALSEHVDLPLELLHPGEAEARYTVAYGCAVQAAGAATYPLNLTLARVTVAREVEQRRHTRFSWGALAGSVLVSGALVFGAAVAKKREGIGLAEARLKQAGGIVPKVSVAPAALKKAAAAIDEARAARVPAVDALSILSRQLPPGTWLAEVSYNAETGCVVRGYSTQLSGAQRAQMALLRQRKFDEVTLDYRTEERISGVPVWGFQLSCKLQRKDAGGRRRR